MGLISGVEEYRTEHPRFLEVVKEAWTAEVIGKFF